jgi:hypothetical protein
VKVRVIVRLDSAEHYIFEFIQKKDAESANKPPFGGLGNETIPKGST